MPILSSVHRTRLVAFCLLAGVAAASVSAQSGATLRSDVYTAAQLSAEQRANVEGFVAEQVRRLLTGVPSTVQDARNQLISPLKGKISGASFKDNYSAIVANEMESREVAKHRNPLVRLNGMIIAGKLTGQNGVDLATAGLADGNPGVRYAASAALLAIASVPPEETDLPAVMALHQRLLDAVVRPLSSEVEPDVRRNLYDVLNHLERPEARTALIGALEAQADRYAEGGLTDAVFAEAAALAGLRKKILAMWVTATNTEDVKPVVKAQTVIAAKYVKLVARYLTSGSPFEGRMQAVCVDLVRAAEAGMNYGLDKFDPDQWDPKGGKKDGPALEQPLKNGDVGAFALNALAWVGGDIKKGLLTEQKIAIPAADLALPKAKPVEAAAAGARAE